MSLTQNDRIRQVGEKTLVIGVDIASEQHWARAFDWRGLEYGKVMSFENSGEGFNKLKRWASELMAKAEKDSVMVGMEPTGHYWFPFAFWLREEGVEILLVNPLHVKRSKELDDGQPSKHDRKDPKTIAKLVLEGRYSEPYIPEGVYSDLRVTIELRWRVVKELTVIENRIQRWLKIYFPEYGQVFRSFTGAASMTLLKQSPLPCDLAELGTDGITPYGASSN